MLPVILFVAVLLCALLVIPLGLPGTWAMVAAALVYMLAVPRSGVSVIVVGGTAVLALIAEMVELLVVSRVTRKYGGSKRAGWGAVLGGFAGVIVGVPVPIVGPILGGMAGSFLGALIGEFETGRGHAAATRVAMGAVVARVAAQAVKVAIGVGMAAWIVTAAMVV